MICKSQLQEIESKLFRSREIDCLGRDHYNAGMSIRLRRADFWRMLALVTLIALAWCFAQNRLTLRNWNVPLSFAGDGILVYAQEKATVDGNYSPFGYKTNPDLGAPFVANWNDFPFTEDLLWYAAGTVSRFFGLFAGASLMALFAHLLSGLSMFAVCRFLRCRWEWSFVGALAYGLAPYAFARAVPHLGLTYFWHIPLCLLVCGWCGSRRGLETRGREFWFAVSVACLTGIQNIYYANPFLQFLALAGLAQIIRGQSWRKIITPFVIGAVTVFFVLVMNLDTIVYQITHGPNLGAAIRTYQSVEMYALKPLDLFMPPPTHHLGVTRAIANAYANDPAKAVLFRGEIFYGYLGVFGIAGLLGLGGTSVARILRRPSGPIPMEAGQVLWLLLYGVVGGANGLLGQLGFMFFRCTNRYSIYILAIVLSFTIKQLSRATQSWPRIATRTMAAALTIVILWDQLPRQVSQSQIDELDTKITSDRVFAHQMESELPPAAMVFQLPLMRFPEYPAPFKMTDYEHFRPYLHTRSLRYSYGDDKGRGREDWQFEMQRLPVADMIQKLEEYGFRALYVNRSGYADRAEKLIQDCAAAGRARSIGSPAGDLTSIFLNAASKPALPPPWPEFRKGWYFEEHDNTGAIWRWSNGNAELRMTNNSEKLQRFRVRFTLLSVNARTVEIWNDRKLLYQSAVAPTAPVPVSLELNIRPGYERLSFKTQPPVGVAGSVDKRLFGFAVHNLSVNPIE